MERYQYARAVEKMMEAIPKEIGERKFHSEKHAYACSAEEKYAHCKYLLNNVLSLFDIGKKEKASRHLAFAQALLWTQSKFSIKELMEANMPDEAEFSEYK
ncbi:hypothetical protein A2996_02360 [Candidatus Campbellbacteria bacterium RIFCSPLOWO2_01_FULL_34_15]|jgi:hypothetical protein|uniref:Uncharacterized protein n=2 Tax=Candidatus Campbelliibacteriota TaxID=1752727 RepID=A0A1F5ELU3_9BACT|nr:MAG: hypothetical protein A2811_01405 [Candidatus Campbellbacteria bacterium RIFCSPHIGHO2_01_FULL_34_10]OGD68389.1 MAG: hypothetical protein A2996_02360 [Candidatus Campbellbacteria bacterium RIFCSPLOWO2_01_FULL_34_15]